MVLPKGPRRERAGLGANEVVMRPRWVGVPDGPMAHGAM